MQLLPQAREKPSFDSPAIDLNFDLFDSGNEKKEVEREGTDRRGDVAPSGPVMPSSSPLVPVYFLLKQVLFSIVFAVFLFSRCASHHTVSRVSGGNAPRQLAENLSSSTSSASDDIEKIFQICLELEKSLPDSLQQPVPQTPVRQPQAAPKKDDKAEPMLWDFEGPLLPLLLTPEEAQADQNITTSPSTLESHLATPPPPFTSPPQQAQREGPAEVQSTQASSAVAEAVVPQPHPNSTSYSSTEGWWSPPAPHPTTATAPAEAAPMQTSSAAAEAVVPQPLPNSTAYYSTEGWPAPAAPHPTTATAPAEAASMQTLSAAAEAMVPQPHPNSISYYSTEGWRAPSAPHPATATAPAEAASVQTSSAAVKAMVPQPLLHIISHSSTEAWPATPAPHPTTTTLLSSPYPNLQQQQLEIKPGPVAQGFAPVTQGFLLSSMLQEQMGDDVFSPPHGKRLKLQIPSETEDVETARSSGKNEDGGRDILAEALAAVNADEWLYSTSWESPLPGQPVDEVPGPSGQAEVSHGADYALQPLHYVPVQLGAPESRRPLPVFGLVPDNPSSDSGGTSGAVAHKLVPYGSDAASVSEGQNALPLPKGDRPGDKSPDPLSRHPFYRLPMLGSGVWTPPFAPVVRKRAETLKANRAALKCLRNLRILFLKQSLNQNEAAAVLVSALRLSDVLLRHHTQPVSGFCTSIAASQLARRYLIADAILSAIHVLGAAEESVDAFKKLMQRVSIVMLPTEKVQRRPPSEANLEVIRRLEALLAQLRTGVRPSPADTVQMKRDILNRIPHKDMKGPQFNSWRRDDKKFNSGRGKS
ncbi:hypothetical protein EBH_0007890 [Eimeria brunetti]|uniref:Uncharacterized protein n=1 Tax=Eimeria brunetti TaxID=51314 RepID=U6LYD1_9EIME|nr:hypothetical protein EBH_0007890 [Eimeria brunetti]